MVNLAVMPPPLTALLDDLRAEQADLRALVAEADLDTPTPAEGWDVRDAVAHLAGTDVEALRAATDPDAFLAGLPEVAKDIEGFLTGQLVARRGLSREELLADWQAGFDAMVDGVRRRPGRARRCPGTARR